MYVRYIRYVMDSFACTLVMWMMLYAIRYYNKYASFLLSSSVTLYVMLPIPMTISCLELGETNPYNNLCKKLYSTITNWHFFEHVSYGLAPAVCHSYISDPLNNITNITKIKFLLLKYITIYVKYFIIV